MALVVRNARLVDSHSRVDILCEDALISAIEPAGSVNASDSEVLDASGLLLAPPYVEPHVHLDAVLTAGQPRWNASGTLWEGIERWAERKPMLTAEDVAARVHQVLHWYVANGVLHIRTHIDVTDPELTALRALIGIRDEVHDVVTLQLVAFPQKASCRSTAGRRCWSRR